MLTLDTPDLFDGFDPAEVAAVRQARERELQQTGVARAHRSMHRRHLRRVTAEKHLADILPARFEPGESYHVVSHGDIDALSYLRHALAGAGYFEHVLLSTWCIAADDLDEIASWLDRGLIETAHLCAGEIFPSQYGEVYSRALELVADYGLRLTIARNHSKVILASNQATGCFLVMEGSANVNTNPRVEQTAIHADRALHDFYLDFYRGLRSIDRDRPRHPS